MEPMITPAPVPRGALLHKRGGSSSNSSGALDTCGYLSGDYGMILTLVVYIQFPPFSSQLPLSAMTLLTTDELLSNKHLL